MIRSNFGRGRARRGDFCSSSSRVPQALKQGPQDGGDKAGFEVDELFYGAGQPQARNARNSAPTHHAGNAHRHTPGKAPSGGDYDGGVPPPPPLGALSTVPPASPGRGSKGAAGSGGGDDAWWCMQAKLRILNAEVTGLLEQW